MTIYTDCITKILTEGLVEPISRDSLDPQVFNFVEGSDTPYLQEGIKAQIMIDIERLSGILPIRNVMIVDSILLPSRDRTTPINVVIEVDAEQVTEISTHEIMFHVQRLTKKLAHGTIHPINYIVSPNPVNVDKAAAVYDVTDSIWIKTASAITGVAEEWMSAIRESLSSIDVRSGDMLRNIIPFKDIKMSRRGPVAALAKEIQKEIDRVNRELGDIATMMGNKQVTRLVTRTNVDLVDILYDTAHTSLPESVAIILMRRMYLQRIQHRLNIILTNKKTPQFDPERLVKNTPIGTIFKAV